MKTSQMTKLVTDVNYCGVIGRCKACGSEVSDYLCNASLKAVRSDADGWDYWMACDNGSCANHHGEGYYFQQEPSFYAPA